MNQISNLKSLDKINEDFLHATCALKTRLMKNLLIEQNADIHYANGIAIKMMCSDNNVKMVHFLLKSDKLKEHANINVDDGMCLAMASRNGALEVMDYMINSKELETHIDLKVAMRIAFLGACDTGEIKSIEYLLQYEELKNNLTQYVEQGLKNACEGERVNIIEFLMKYNNTPGYEILSNIELLEECFLMTCEKQYIEGAKYFLRNQKVDITNINNKVFQKVLEYASSESDFFQYLIFQEDLQLNDEMKEHISKTCNPQEIQKIELLYKEKNTLDLFSKLDEILEKSPNNKKKKKKI